MLYLDYAKQVGDRYILNFFADSVEDIDEVADGKEFITKNGTNYGVPLASSTIVITMPDKSKKTYMLGEDGNWSDIQMNPGDYYTKTEADRKFAAMETVDDMETEITELKSKPIYKHSVFIHKNTDPVNSKDEWLDFTFYSNIKTPIKKRDLCPVGSEGTWLHLAQTFGHHHTTDMTDSEGYIISIDAFNQGFIRFVKYDGTVDTFTLKLEDACTVSDAVYRMDSYSVEE